LTVTDDDDSTDTTCHVVTILDLTPAATFNWSPGPQDEGLPVQFTDASTSSPDAIVAWAWDFDDLGTSDEQNPGFTFLDNGVYKVCLTVTDDDDSTDSTCHVVTINNVAPSCGEVSAPLDPVQIDELMSVQAGFSDPGLLDTHSAIWHWGDGSNSVGVVDEYNGSGFVSGSYSYIRAGVYTLGLTVSDDDGGTCEAPPFEYIVAFDPAGGFITGGGWIISPAGAFASDPSLSGKVTFGFNSKYKALYPVPSGETEFQFRLADINFHSISYDWLIIADGKATFTGRGSINGDGVYGFFISVIDGKIQGGEDKFRMKIWDLNTNEVLYDTMMGESINADPDVELGGGSIVVHKAK
jgi:PKD repeat protein